MPALLALVRTLLTLVVSMATVLILAACDDSATDTSEPANAATDATERAATTDSQATTTTAAAATETTQTETTTTRAATATTQATTATTVAATASAPTTSSTTTSILLPPILEGSRVRHDEAIFGNGLMNSIAASEIGLVAVGASGSAAAVWSSPDGLNWTRVLGVGLMNSVAGYGGGFVAVGSDDSGGDADAAVWLSPDGLNWTRVPHDETVFGGDDHEFMVSVTSFHGGLVAVGQSDGLTRSGSAVWTSPDGRAWTRRDAPIFENVSTVDVAPFGGRLIAVGFDSSSGDADAAVWLSPDGLNWTRVPHDETVFGGDDDQIMVSVAGFDEGLVAVGFDQGGIGDAAAWTSPDGYTWMRVSHDESIFGGRKGGGAEMTAVEAFDEGLVAVGFDQFEGDMDAVVWTTSDGLTWKRVSSDESIFGGDGAQRIASLAVVDGNVVAVGFHAPSGRNFDSMTSDAAVWRLTP